MSAPLLPPQLGQGLRLLAIGDARYRDCFGIASADFLASLAPFLAFSIVGGAVLAMEGQWRDAGVFLLYMTCTLLAPPVIADIFCRVWRRDAAWAHFATIYNWARWLFMFVTMATALVVTLLFDSGLGIIVPLVLLVFWAYVIWLSLFMARTALDISWVRALVLSLAVGMGTLMLTVLSQYSHWHHMTWSDMIDMTPLPPS